jgi:hypothetical protein
MSWEKVKYYMKKGLYYVPGVGLGIHIVREYRTRKGKHPWYNLREAKDRKALGMYAIETAYFTFAITSKVWLGDGIATKEWNPIHQFKNYTEKREKNIERRLERKNELEKTVHYEELLK